MPLDRLLVRLYANKSELLIVLDRPEIPLRTDTSENDVRCHVTRRKVSGATAISGATAAMPYSASSRPAKAQNQFLGLSRRNTGRPTGAYHPAAGRKWCLPGPGEAAAYCRVPKRNADLLSVSSAMW
jgi:hypothetical protein